MKAPENEVRLEPPPIWVWPVCAVVLLGAVGGVLVFAPIGDDDPMVSLLVLPGLMVAAALLGWAAWRELAPLRRWSPPPVPDPDPVPVPDPDPVPVPDPIPPPPQKARPHHRALKLGPSASPMYTPWSLYYLTPEQQKGKILLPLGREIYLGRDLDVDLVVDAGLADVSGKHLLFVVEENRVHVVDISRNGTRIEASKGSWTPLSREEKYALKDRQALRLCAPFVLQLRLCKEQTE